MKHFFSSIFFLSMGMYAAQASAQVSTSPNAALAALKCDSAVKLADKGLADQSIRLLAEAIRLDPGQIRYPSEMAYSFYLKNDLPSATSILSQQLAKPEADEKLFLFLGTLYIQNGQTEKAEEIYHAGLLRFPQSGKIYAALVEGLIKSKNYYPALSEAEKGIQADPSVADNYYWAAQLYCHSSEKVWGMLYGEIFLNLNHGIDSVKQEQMSRTLFSTFIKAVHVQGGEVTSVDFTDLSTSDPGDNNSSRLPFQVRVYENLILNASKGESILDLYSLNLIRARFEKAYFDKNWNTTYPNALLDYQDKVARAGFLEAYNYWIFQSGNPSQFTSWTLKNAPQYQAFKEWLAANPLSLNRTSFFSSSQYAWKEKPETVKIERKIRESL